jgi:hypothetical protein
LFKESEIIVNLDNLSKDLLEDYEIVEIYDEEDNVIPFSKEEINRSEEHNIPLRVFHMALWLINRGIPKRILEAKNQKEAFDIALEVPGYANFLAYQVFIDLSYIPEFPFSENEFTVCGPGCKRGIDRLFEDRDGLSYEEAIFWIRDNQDYYLSKYNIDLNELMKDLPKYDRRITVMDCENAFCEHSKYTKVYYNEGRPKVRYNGESKLF